jgi:hypothetical protein
MSRPLFWIVTSTMRLARPLLSQARSKKRANEADSESKQATYYYMIVSKLTWIDFPEQGP